MSDAGRIGDLVNHYRIISMLGKGGMGEVFLAEDTKLERRVALKLLLTDLASDATRVRRFVQEAKAASALNHPNILTVHEIGSFEDSQYIVTEYIKGETLRERLNDGPVTLRETLDMTMQIAAALSAAHSAGIVHRDIKPENIMIRDDGFVKVLDFGLAKLIEKKRKAADSKDATRVKTDPGMIMGTANYMSPEQARGKETDARTDVWSLGVVLYEMLSGETPFAGETANDSIAAILTKEPATLTTEIPHELHKFVRRALQKNPDERYQTVKDFLLDVQDLKRELEVSEEIERSHIPPMSRSTNVGITQSGENVTAMHAGAVSTQNSIGRQPSSAEYIVSEIRQHRRGFLALAAILATTLAGGIGWWYMRSGPAAAEVGRIDSVAVLPFENGSGDPNMDFLSDGLSESLIDKLSQLPQLKVIARTSSFKYRGPNIDIQDVAQKLGVQAIVMGKVVRQGDQLMVRVEMIDAHNDKQLWGEQFNRKATDALALQQEIAQTVSDKLRIRLSGSQQQTLAKVGTSNAQAYELFLRGKFVHERGGRENRQKAIQLFEQAVAADPQYAAAYAYLSDSYNILAGNSLADPKEYVPKAETAARKALELDGNIPEAHKALAGVYLHQWKWSDAGRELERAIELNPNFRDAHLSYAFYLAIVGRHDEAVAEAKRAVDLDPVSPLARGRVALCLYFARRNDEAIEAANKLIEMDPTYAFGNVVLGYSYAGKGMYREAVKSHLDSAPTGRLGSSTQIFLGAAYANAGERAKALEILNQLKSSKEYVSPGELPVLLVALGDYDTAFASFERAFEAHDLQLMYLKVDPSFDPIRSDPRFADLLGRVGLSK